MPTCRTLSWTILLMLVIAGAGPTAASLHGQSASDEVLLKRTTEELYRAIERNDLASYLTFWTARQQQDKQFVQDTQKFLALAKERRYEHLAFSRIDIDGDRANLRLAFDYSYLDDQTNQRVNNHIFHNLSFVKENGDWKLLRRSYATDDLFDALTGVKTGEEATRLLNSEKELITVDLVHKLNKAVDKQANAAKAMPESETRALLFKDAFILSDAAFTAVAALHDESELAWCYLYRAFILEAQPQAEAALDNFQHALSLFRETKDQDGEARALYNMANTYRNAGKLTEALAQYEAAVRISKETNDLDLQERALAGMGLAHNSKFQYPEAMDDYQAALQVIRNLGDKRAELTMMSGIGDLWVRMARYQAGLKQYLSTLELAREIGDKQEEALALNDIGSIYYVTDRYAEAAEQCQASLKLSREIGYPRGEAKALVSVGNIFQLRGEYANALIYYEMALKIARGIKDIELEGSSLNNIAVLYRESGRFTEAIAQLTESLKIARELKDKRAEGETLQNIGAAYVGLGKYTEAISQYEASLKIARELVNIEGWISVLQNIGALYTATKQYDEALRLFGGALTIAHANNNKFKEVTVLNNLGVVYMLMGRDEDALRASQSALAIAQAIGSTDGELHSYEVLGVIYEREKRWSQAADAYRQAIRRIELLRTQAKEQSLQTSLLGNLILPYQKLAQSLLELNQGSEAFAVSEQAKARALVDLLQNGKVNILKAMTGAERQQEQELDSRITTLQRELNGARSGRAGDFNIEEGKQQLAAARSAYEEFRRRLFLRHPELQAQRAQFEPVNLVQLNQTLFTQEPGLCLLSYLAGDDETFLFAITRGKDDRSPAAVKVYKLRIKSADLAKQIEQFRRKCGAVSVPAGSRSSRAEIVGATSLKEDYKTDARALYQALNAPAERELAGKTQVIVVPDGVLHTLPFQALIDKQGRHLIERFAVSYAPSVTALQKMSELAEHRGNGTSSVAEKSGTDKLTLLAVGRPDFSPGLNDLPATESEVKAIARLFGVKPLIGPEATKSQIKAEMAKARYLHFATHGLLNEGAPMYSAIALSQTTQDDGLLSAREIIDMDLSAEMVVLSACETALGREAKGEGILGLTWALFVAGAPTSVVSQWQVDDQSTSALMVDFYDRMRGAEALGSKAQARESKGLTKAEALRQAQLRLMLDGKHSHPYYWAPFILIGNWK